MELFRPTHSAAPVGTDDENQSGEVFGPDTDLYEVGHVIDPEEAMQHAADDGGMSFDPDAIAVRLVSEARTLAMGADNWSSQLFSVPFDKPIMIAPDNPLRSQLIICNQGTDVVAIGPDDSVSILGNGLVVVNQVLPLPLTHRVWALGKTAAQLVTVYQFFNS